MAAAVAQYSYKEVVTKAIYIHQLRVLPPGKPVQLQALPEATNQALYTRLVDVSEWGQISVDKMGLVN